MSGLLQSPRSNAVVLMDTLGTDDFGFSHHQAVWCACWHVWNGESESLDLAELYLFIRHTRARHEFRNLATWLADLWLEDPFGAEAPYYAMQVRWLAQRRNAIHRSRELIQDAADGVLGLDDERLMSL